MPCRVATVQPAPRLTLTLTLTLALTHTLTLTLTLTLALALTLTLTLTLTRYSSLRGTSVLATRLYLDTTIETPHTANACWGFDAG